MKGSGEYWVAVGDEGEGFGKVVLTHEGLKVGEGLLPWPSLPASPVHVQ